jgi:hypothetical protein
MIDQLFHFVDDLAEDTDHARMDSLISRLPTAAFSAHHKIAE